MQRSVFLAAVAGLGLLALPAVTAAPAPAPAVATAVAGEDARLTAFLDAQFDEEMAASPELATELGSPMGNDRWDDSSDAGEARALVWRRASVAAMKAGFDRPKLSPEAQVNYDIWVLELERAELRAATRRYRPPYYSYLRPLHTGLANFLINVHNVASAADMRGYNARLRGIPALLDAGIARSRASAAAGIRAPKFQIERVIAGGAGLTAGAPFVAGKDSPLWADARAKVDRLRAGGSITAAEAEALLAETRAALLELKPALDRVTEWAQAELATAPEGRVGAGSLPGGAEFYAAALKLATTTDLDAAQIHKIGLAEVARLKADQDRLVRAAGFADRAAFLADRDKRFPTVAWTDELRADYLAKSNAAIAQVRALVPKYFNTLPAHRIEVIREPAFSEVPGGAAHAAAPSPDGARAGLVYVHMAGTIPNFARIPNLMCHEGVPGHVMQGDIQVRQSVGPKFRKSYGYVAFGEGWGLYAEALCREMGVYSNVGEEFANIDSELFRAIRLVVDTGLHAKGWSEDEAVKYMIEQGANPQQVKSEVRRYITNPGQATGYKIGMIKIVELRDRAEKALGRRFDIKGFHDLLIASGDQPLSILERRVDAWIAATRA